MATSPLTGALLGSVLAFAMLVAPEAHAAGDSEGGAAAAESLFQEARKAMDAKRYSVACPKLAASQKLAPAIGTLLNLADCYEKNNQLASAWSRFHEAIALAQRLGRSNREQTAKERADKLEPRLIRLTISAHPSAREVKLDGNPLDREALGTAIPVDEGKHTIEGSAKGKKTFTNTIEVSEKLKDPNTEIPALEDEPKEAPKLTPPPKEPRNSWNTQKTIGIVVAGAGVVGLGVGGFFGLRTSSTWKEAQTHCTGTECDREGVDLAADAKSSGNIATISAIAGGALLIGGAVIYLTADSGRGKTTANPRGSMRLGLGPGSILLGGTFQ